jgi:hypothetical protein
MVAASDGTFSTQVSLTQAGSATITATGEQSHLTVAATVSVAPATIVASTKSTKHALPGPNIEVLIGVLAIVVLLVAAGIAWPRRWRKPSPAYDVSTT